MKKIIFFLLPAILIYGCSNTQKNKEKLQELVASVDTTSSVDTAVMQEDQEKIKDAKMPDEKDTYYLKKKVVYEYPDTSFGLYHVKVKYNEQYEPLYYFLAVPEIKRPEDSVKFVYIMEYTDSEGIFKIDSFPPDAFSSDLIHSELGVFFPEFLLKHYDNLHLFYDELFYYKPEGKDGKKKKYFG